MSGPRDVVELLQELVRIPSVNPHGETGGAQTGENDCAAFIGDYLRELGAEVEMQQVQPGRPNVIGRFPTDRHGKKRVVLAPHTDTVSVGGMTVEPFGGERRNSRIYGRGASDTKGSIAAMLIALHECRERLSSLEHEIWFAGLMGEETGQEGSRAFVKEFRADFALIGEPTSLEVVHTHKGMTTLTLTTTGVAVHSSEPHRGVNAIYKMLDAAEFIRKTLAPRLASHRHEVLGPPTLSIGTIAGGTKVNIVPGHCKMEVDIRTVPSLFAGDLPLHQWLDEMRSALPDVELHVWEARPLDTPPSHPLVQALESRCVGAPWYCDAAVFAEAGIPAVAAGPGSITQAHTKDEWIEESALREGVSFYRRFLERC